ncbi:MAG: alpha/beta fold hydrolase [Candidatus Dormibacteraceae bacterium]
MLVRSGDLEVAIHEWGSGPPLLLLHGLGDDHRAWRRMLPRLCLGHRVLAPDLRGHGGTSVGRGAGSFAQLAEDQVALLDTLGLDQVDLAGFSMGGTIALKLAIEAPDRVRRLLPIATSSRVGRVAVAWYQERARIADQGAAALRVALADDVETQFLPGSPLIGEHLRLKEQATADPRGFANGCRANIALGGSPLDPDLPRIGAPTLVVAAEKDQLCPPRAGEIVVAGIPGARLEIVAGAAHEVPVERPEALADLVLRFLDGP